MTKQLFVGKVPVGGGAPVSIQSMCNTKTDDVAATVAQIKELEAAGCEIIRVAIPDQAAAEAVDSMHWDEIAGTMAGDNTIFIAAKNEKAVPEIMERLGMMIRK